MTSLVSGKAYVDALNASEKDRACRRAFQNLVFSLCPLGGTVFDFGCGAGTDAKLFASRGIRVDAYDVDSDMCAYFTEVCAIELQSGSITLETGEYGDFLERHMSASHRKSDLVTANFAPVNLVASPRELFRAFSNILTVQGRVLASVLNPFCAGDMRYRWWWKNAGKLVAKGSYAVDGAQAPIRRWSPVSLASEVAPMFVVEAIFAGSAKDAADDSLPRKIRMSSVRDWPAIASSQFLFLLFKANRAH